MTNNAIDSNIPIEISKGGTGQSFLAINSVLLGNGTAGITTVTPGATNTVLNGNTAAAPTFGQLPIAAISNGSNGQLIVGGGSAPAWATITAGSNISLTTGPNSLTVSLIGNASRAAAHYLYWQGSPAFSGSNTGWVTWYGTGFSTVSGGIAKFVAPTTGYYKICFTQGLNTGITSNSTLNYVTGTKTYNGAVFTPSRWSGTVSSLPPRNSISTGFTIIYIYLVAGDDIRNTAAGQTGSLILTVTPQEYSNRTYFTAASL